MKINNAQEFANFLRLNGLVNLNAETAIIVRCLDEFGRMCGCDPPAARNAKLNQCRSHYMNFVSRATAHKDELLSKINDSLLTFAIDGQVIVHLSR